MSHQLEGHGKFSRIATHGSANKLYRAPQTQDCPRNVPPLRAPQILEELILTLEQEVSSMSTDTLSAMEQAICGILTSIRRRHEEVTSAPAIHRFPFELLCSIFDHARISPGEPPFRTRYYSHSRESGPPLALPDSQSLVTVTHVCRRWRSAAMGFPSLWADVVAQSSSALTFAERASSSPLTVHVEVADAQLSAVQNKTLWRLRPRIGRLVLRLQSRLELKMFRSVLAALAGTLESLVVIIGRAYHAFAEEHANPNPFSRGWTFFGGSTPTALKSLVIESYRLLIPADFCPNLRSFTLRARTHSWPPNPSPLSLFVHFLSHTPLLENLRLDPSIRCALTLVGDPFPPPAFLPELRNLSLTGFDGIDWSDLAIPAVASPSRGPISRELVDVVVDTDREGYHWLLNGRSRAAPHLHVRMAIQARCPPWLAESTHTLRIIVRRSEPITYGVPALGRRDVPAFKGLPDFHLLDTLIVRLAIGGFALDRLGFWLVQTNPFICPSLRVLILSILNPRCTLDALRPLYAATTRRAELGHPLQRLFVCSPIHTGPDYSVRDLHGVEWVTFSGTDVGAPCRDAPHFPSTSSEGTSPLARQSLEEPQPFSAVYDAAWEACATEGLVETHVRMHWHRGSRLW